MFFFEGTIVFRFVGTDPKYHDVPFIKFVDSIPESLSFGRSARGRGTREKPEDYFPTFILIQRVLFAAFVGNLKFRSPYPLGENVSFFARHGLAHHLSKGAGQRGKFHLASLHSLSSTLYPQSSSPQSGLFRDLIVLYNNGQRRELSLHLNDLLKFMVSQKASDLHLKPMRPPLLRIEGRLTPIQAQPLPPEHIDKLIKEVLSEKQKKHLEEFLYVSPHSI
jgi:hypothetical protein